MTNIYLITLLGAVFIYGCHVPIKWIYLRQNVIEIFLLTLLFTLTRFLLVRIKLSSAVVTNKPLNLSGLTYHIHTKADMVWEVLLPLEAESSGIWPWLLFCQGQRGGKGPGFYLFQPRGDTSRLVSSTTSYTEGKLHVTQKQHSYPQADWRKTNIYNPKEWGEVNSVIAGLGLKWMAASSMGRARLARCTWEGQACMVLGSSHIAEQSWAPRVNLFVSSKVFPWIYSGNFLAVEKTVNSKAIVPGCGRLVGGHMHTRLTLSQLRLFGSEFPISHVIWHSVPRPQSC